MNFYITVVLIAVVLLIIILAAMGILINRSSKTTIYPPTYNNCPDYWSATDLSGNCTINNVNAGYLDGSFSTTNTPGYKKTDNLVNFNDTSWTSTYSSSQMCAWKTWANANNIEWDGISNYNGCATTN
jgi:hypothetical protein